MRSREEFLKWVREQGTTLSMAKVYDFLCGPNTSETKTWLDAKEPKSIEEVISRNKTGRTFEVNQFNCRQLQLDLEFMLADQSLNTQRACEIEWPSDEEKFKQFKTEWENYPSQDNEGYLPDRGGFKAGFFSCFNWLRSRMKGEKE
jgi:hypothetical protein